MSRRMTEIHLPQSSAGVAEWGERDAPTMIAALRSYAAHLREQAEAVERAADHEFQIRSYDGVHVQRNGREIQRSSRLPSPGKDATGSMRSAANLTPGTNQNA